MKKILLGISLVAMLGACTSTPTVQQTAENKGNYDVQSGNQLGNLPAWILSPYVENSQSAVGMAKVGAGGLSVAKDKALSRARVELATQLNTKVQAMTEDYVSTVGEGDNEVAEQVFSKVSRQVTDQSLSGSKQVDMYLTKDKELYILVAVQNKTIKNSIKKNVNSEIETLTSDEKLYQEFKSEQAQKRLDSVIDKELEKK